MNVYRTPGLAAVVLAWLLAAGSAAQQKQAPDKPTQDLVDEASKLLKGDRDEQQKLIPLIHHYLKAKKNKVDEDDVQIAFEIASMLERGNYRDLAAQAYTQFSKDVAAAGNRKLADLTLFKVLQGASRRYNAPGQEIAIKGKTLDGQEIDLDKLKGKVVLVDFWATWCPPCRRELPNIQAMYEKYHEQGFEVIGVSVDQKKEELQKFLKEAKLPWPTIYDHGAAPGQQLQERYGVLFIPETFLVDRAGKVVSLEAHGAELGVLLARLLEKK
jgi:thiol-disulfide isomerase/thioredoxin